MAQVMGIPVVAAKTFWGSGIIQCVDDPPVCWDTFCCAPCSVARQWAAAEGRADEVELPICLMNTFCGCTVLTNCVLRWKVVQKYNIDEEPFMTGIIACVVPLCSACQTHRELGRRGTFPGGTCCVGLPPQPMNMQGGAPPGTQTGGYKQV